MFIHFFIELETKYLRKIQKLSAVQCSCTLTKTWQICAERNICWLDSLHNIIELYKWFSNTWYTYFQLYIQHFFLYYEQIMFNYITVHKRRLHRLKFFQFFLFSIQSVIACKNFRSNLKIWGLFCFALRLSIDL